MCLNMTVSYFLPIHLSDSKFEKYIRVFEKSMDKFENWELVITDICYWKC